MAAFPEFNLELLPYPENTTGMDLPCVAERNWFSVAFIPLNVIAIFVNLVVLLASMLDKEKLQRQNYMFASVNSALLSHVVYLSLNIWGAAANVMAVDAPNVRGIPKVMWTVCEAGVSSIMFGVVANASSLIYVTIDSTFVAPRFGGSGATMAHLRNDEKSKLPKKRAISILLMTVSWLVPMIFITIATLVWNCAEDCWCPTGNYQGEVCPHEYRCSRFWAPMTSSFLLVNIGLWTLQITVLIGMIVKKMMAFNTSARPAAVDSTPGSDENAAERNLAKDNRQSTTSTTPTRRSRAYLNPRFRFAIILTIMLVICFVPASLSILIDAFKPDANLVPAKIISTISLYLYMVSCPFLILKYLPSLRVSLSQLFRKIFFCFA